MPSLDDVRERIGALEAEIQSKDKVPLTGHIIMACHTLPYVCNLREASPESPTPQMEIQPGDNVTMPQGLHTPTGTDRTIEQWPVLAEPVQSPELLASVRHLNSPSTKSGSSRTSSVSASRSDTPGALRAFTARQQSQHPGSGSITPSRPPSPSPMQQQYFPPMPNGSAHKPDEPVPRSSSSAYKFRWVLQPRRGHSALNAGIRSLADRQMTLVAWPGDLRNHEGEPMESRCLTDEQRHALVDGLSNLAQGPTDDETPPEEGADAQNRVGIRCRPVWLDDKEASLHYEGFCKGYAQGKGAAVNKLNDHASQDTSGRCSTTCLSPSIRTKLPKAPLGRPIKRSIWPSHGRWPPYIRRATSSGSRTTSALISASWSRCIAHHM